MKDFRGKSNAKKLIEEVLAVAAKAAKDKYSLRCDIKDGLAIFSIIFDGNTSAWVGLSKESHARFVAALADQAKEWKEIK